LEQRFRDSLGSTPYAFINDLRVERAKRLLAEPNKTSLTEIAAACGFSDLRRFRLVFRRLAKLTPAQYRRTCREQS
jgi:transcriptional regulator GlxA family with amidase domain